VSVLVIDISEDIDTIVSDSIQCEMCKYFTF